MTKADKPTIRDSYSTIRERGKNRSIVVTVNSTWLGLRLKGTRKTYQLDIGAAFSAAVRAEVEQKRREKQAAKKAKKESK